VADALYGAVVAPVHSYVERAPGLALNDLARVAWIQRIGAAPYLQRNLPAGEVELHCPAGSRPPGDAGEGKAATRARDAPRLTPRDHKAAGVVVAPDDVPADHAGQARSGPLAAGRGRGELSHLQRRAPTALPRDLLSARMRADICLRQGPPIAITCGDNGHDHVGQLPRGSPAPRSHERASGRRGTGLLSIDAGRQAGKW
jgi:hypothetical protein